MVQKKKWSLIKKTLPGNEIKLNRKLPEKDMTHKGTQQNKANAAKKRALSLIKKTLPGKEIKLNRRRPEKETKHKRTQEGSLNAAQRAPRKRDKIKPQSPRERDEAQKNTRRHSDGCKKIWSLIKNTLPGNEIKLIHKLPEDEIKHK